MSDIREFPLFPYRNYDDVLPKVASIHEQINENAGAVMGIVHNYNDTVALYELAYGLHGPTLGHVVQFGTHQAGSACIMGQGLKDAGHVAPVVTIDPYRSWDHPKWGQFAYVKSQVNINELGLSEYVCPVIFDDIGFIKSCWDSPVRLVMIDTIHTEEQTKKEIEVILPYVVSRGWFYFHDYHKEFPGCVQAINEFIDSMGITDVYRCLLTNVSSGCGIAMRLPI